MSPLVLFTFGYIRIGSTEQNNHGSVHNKEIEQWFRQLKPINNSFKVLDVGGGKGHLSHLITKTNPKLQFEYYCIDIVPQKNCQQFDGSVPTAKL
jgi:hypothetical protein